MFLLCWHYLFSRAVTRKVFSATVSLTSVFGMGTGGSFLPLSPLWLYQNTSFPYCSVPVRSATFAANRTNFRYNVFKYTKRKSAARALFVVFPVNKQACCGFLLFLNLLFRRLTTTQQISCTFWLFSFQSVLFKVLSLSFQGP